MTYQKFLDIVYDTSKEKDYYGWVNATRKPTVKDQEKYSKYCNKMDKISKFKQKVLSEALKNLSDNYFD